MISYLRMVSILTNVQEALRQIKQAEDNHNELINHAKQKAAMIILDAEQLAKQTYEEIVTTSKEKAKKIKEAAILMGEQEANTILQQGEKEVKAIRHIEDEQVEKAIKSIIRRIVENNGNR